MLMNVELKSDLGSAYLGIVHRCFMMFHWEGHDYWKSSNKRQGPGLRKNPGIIRPLQVNMVKR